MNDKQLELITPTLNTFENEDIKEFAKVVLDDLPDYVWHVPASSSGKYHPDYSLGEGGLMRHQIAVVNFINTFLSMEIYSSCFSSRERDLLRLSGLVHDGMKSGTQEDWEKNKATKFEHPILMANKIKSYQDKYLDFHELNIIYSSISKHMGQWNTNKKSKVVLPLPNDKFSKLVHTADYLASRKFLTMNFDNFTPVKVEIPPLDDFILPFGAKHKGEKLIDIAEKDPSYITWMKQNIDREPYISLLKELDKRRTNSNGKN